MERTVNRRRWAAFALLAALLMGVATSCPSEGGMYQGPNDSTPYWRS